MLRSLPATSPDSAPLVGASVSERESGDVADLGGAEGQAIAVDSIAADSIAADSVAAANTPVPPVWDLEIEEHASRARVAYYVDAFSGRLHQPFERALGRQTKYSGLIGDRLRAAGLPQDLTFLAFVESWYDPHAYSTAAAVGMWQFMARTAKGVGLRVDWWVDERRDPVRSTEGAVRLLSSLHGEFGSLFLAAAAYNGGQGRVSRGLAQFASRVDPVEGESKFFALSDTRYLRAETRDYVPKIIAAALVAKQPDRYLLNVDTLAPFVFDSVFAPGGAPLTAIAAAAEVPLDSIRELNSHILRGMVPEGDSMWVRVPVGAGEGFDSAYAALDSAERIAVKRVKTKAGEYMALLARRNNITTKQINWYNPRATRLKDGNLVAGQTILIPTKATVAGARDVPNPAVERYPRRRTTTPVRAAPKVPAPAKAPPAKAPPAKAPASATKRP